MIIFEMNPLWYVLEFFVAISSDYSHHREWAKKVCICGHKYFKHEWVYGSKRPFGTCSKCDCNKWNEVEK